MPKNVQLKGQQMASRPKTKVKRTRPTAARRTSSTKRRQRPASGRARGAAKVARAAAKLAGLTLDQVVAADAIGLLMQDHREVEALFAQFDDAEDNAQKASLAQKICLALTVHAEIEEEIFYPRARKATGQHDLLNEAEVEHAGAKQLIAEIESMKPRERLFAAKVKVLSEYVKHHVAEEENELFPKVRETDLDLMDVGRKLLKRKVALLTENA
jgi:hemerythrin superfamily protein